MIEKSKPPSLSGMVVFWANGGTVFCAGSKISVQRLRDVLQLG